MLVSMVTAYWKCLQQSESMSYLGKILNDTKTLNNL